MLKSSLSNKCPVVCVDSVDIDWALLCKPKLWHYIAGFIRNWLFQLFLCSVKTIILRGGAYEPETVKHTIIKLENHATIMIIAD